MRVALFACLALTACQTAPPKPEPEVRTVTVRVPVPVPCVPDTVPQPPAYPDTDAAIEAAPNLSERLKLIMAGRLLRIARAGVTEPVIQLCRRPTP